MGITNVPELALWWETNNTVYGVTNNRKPKPSQFFKIYFLHFGAGGGGFSPTIFECNPFLLAYDLRRTPGGSSGGEGALLAAAGSVIGLGNDVGGSLRVPALFCGVFGLKPGPGNN